MSAMITECADRLVDKFQKLAETQGKIDAKEYNQPTHNFLNQNERGNWN